MKISSFERFGHLLMVCIALSSQVSMAGGDPNVYQEALKFLQTPILVGGPNHPSEESKTIAAKISNLSNARSAFDVFRSTFTYAADSVSRGGLNLRESEAVKFAEEVALKPRGAEYLSTFQSAYRYTERTIGLGLYGSDAIQFAKDVASQPNGAQYLSVFHSAYEYVMRSIGLHLYGSKAIQFAKEVASQPNGAQYLLAFQSAYNEGVSRLLYGTDAYEYAKKGAAAASGKQKDAVKVPSVSIESKRAKPSPEVHEKGTREHLVSRVSAESNSFGGGMNQLRSNLQTAGTRPTQQPQPENMDWIVEAKKTQSSCRLSNEEAQRLAKELGDSKAPRIFLREFQTCFPEQLGYASTLEWTGENVFEDCLASGRTMARNKDQYRLQAREISRSTGMEYDYEEGFILPDSLEREVNLREAKSSEVLGELAKKRYRAKAVVEVFALSLCQELGIRNDTEHGQMLAAYRETRVKKSPRQDLIERAFWRWTYAVNRCISFIE